MHWFWKKKHNGKDVIISPDCHDKLPEEAKKQFERRSVTTSTPTHTVIVEHDDEVSNFGLSAIVGMETESVALGYLAGGSFSGAIVGEMLAEETHHEDFGGGDAGGAGAGGSCDSGSSSDTKDSFDSGGSYDSSSSSDSSFATLDSSSYDSGSSFDSSSSSCGDSSF